METFSEIVGHHSDASLHDRLHELEHEGKVLFLSVPGSEMGRRRFKTKDQNGVEYGVALDRAEELRDGSVLFIDDDRAVVVRGDEGAIMTLRALTTQGAIQLGWHAGHLHWRVRFGDDDTMAVLLDAPPSDYEERIRSWIDNGSIEVVR
jgi:urease accessory protein